MKNNVNGKKIEMTETKVRAQVNGYDYSVCIGEDGKFYGQYTDDGIDYLPLYATNEDDAAEELQVIHNENANCEENPVKAWREAAHMTRQKLSDQTGISLERIQEYEKGIRSIYDAKVATVAKIAKALGTTCEEMLNI